MAAGSEATFDRETTALRIPVSLRSGHSELRERVDRTASFVRNRSPNESSRSTTTLKTIPIELLPQVQAQQQDKDVLQSNSKEPASSKNHITISRDQTKLSGYERDMLLAVLGRDESYSGSWADYQMQLMLLEQQNEKRLLMARKEQDYCNSVIGRAREEQDTVSQMSNAAVSPAGTRSAAAPSSIGIHTVEHETLPWPAVVDLSLPSNVNDPGGASSLMDTISRSMPLKEMPESIHNFIEANDTGLGSKGTPLPTVILDQQCSGTIPRIQDPRALHKRMRVSPIDVDRTSNDLVEDLRGQIFNLQRENL